MSMTADETDRTLADSEMEELRWAYKQLEHPSLAARMSNLLAEPFEEAISLLPKDWQKRWDKTLTANTYRTVRIALMTMRAGHPVSANLWLHKVLAVGAGAAGGFFGPLTLLAELPLTTTLILRSIVDIARAEGEDLSQIEPRMACVYTFAFGARTREDEGADVGYYALRTLLGFHFTRDIVDYATHATAPHIPGIIQLARLIAARFGLVVTDKFALQLVPVAGAVSGATLNLIFMNHFQDVARGHFIVRRLEREHGLDTIKHEYQQLKDEEKIEARDYSPVEGW